MKKQNIQISRCEGLEVYCAREDFNYNCDNTPNNCTECPVMRFLYHDLTTRVLADRPAAALTAIVEEAQAFSGKYAGAKELPAEVWTAIYAIRDAYFSCSYIKHSPLEPDEEGYASEFDCAARFNRWYVQSERFDEAAVARIADFLANRICAGFWVAIHPDGSIMAYAESGFYKPAVFNNYNDGVEFLRHLICKELNIEMFENVGCLPNARMYSVDPQTIQVSLSTYNPRIRHYMNNEGYKELTKRIEEKAYFLKRVDEENVENYRNTYKNQVRQHLTSDAQ